MLNRQDAKNAKKGRKDGSEQTVGVDPEQSAAKAPPEKRRLFPCPSFITLFPLFPLLAFLASWRLTSILAVKKNQCRKWRAPVKTIATPYSLQSATLSSS